MIFLYKFGYFCNSGNKVQQKENNNNNNNNTQSRM